MGRSTLAGQPELPLAGIKSLLMIRKKFLFALPAAASAINSI
jgi:hypothetical protein